MRRMVVVLVSFLLVNRWMLVQCGGYFWLLERTRLVVVFIVVVVFQFGHTRY